MFIKIVCVHFCAVLPCEVFMLVNYSLGFFLIRYFRIKQNWQLFCDQCPTFGIEISNSLKIL